MQKLTDRQEMVLQYIQSSITERGYPPTLREVCERYFQIKPLFIERSQHQQGDTGIDDGGVAIPRSS